MGAVTFSASSGLLALGSGKRVRVCNLCLSSLATLSSCTLPVDNSHVEGLEFASSAEHVWALSTHGLGVWIVEVATGNLLQHLAILVNVCLSSRSLALERLHLYEQ